MIGKQDYENPKITFLDFIEEDIVTSSVQTQDIYDDDGWSDVDKNYRN